MRNSAKFTQWIHIRIEPEQTERLEDIAKKLKTNRSVLTRKLLGLLDNRDFVKKYCEV